MSPVGMLRKFVAPEFVFGRGARKLVPQYVKNYGAHRVLLVTDPGVVKAGWAGDVAQALADAGIEHVVYQGVTSNPRMEEVEEGVRVYTENGCDCIVAVGGGSPMDCAKAIGIVAASGRPITAFEGVDNVEVPGPPLICVPTTAGTAADVSQFAIITNMAERRKFAIISKIVVPDLALVDPETTTTMDSYLTACTGLDSLVHAIEAFVSKANSPMTDTHALRAMELVREALPAVLNDPADIDAREKIMQGCLHAGLAFSNTSLGAVHAMSHSLGGYLDLAHGECNAILLRHVIAYNASFEPERFARVGEALGLNLKGMVASEKEKAVLAEIDRLTRDAGVTETLSRKGVRASDVPYLASNAMRDPCMVTNPRRPNDDDIEVIYEEAL